MIVKTELHLHTIPRTSVKFVQGSFPRSVKLLYSQMDELRNMFEMMYFPKRTAIY